MKTQLTIRNDGSRSFANTEPVSGRKAVLALLMRLLWAAALVLQVFAAQAGAVLTTLHSFQVYTNGANPDAALVQGSDGSFYGTTSQGGTNNMGTAFRISTNGVLTTLYTFGSITDASGVGLDGGNPYAALVQGSDGYFYGTTSQGGTNGTGTMFKISANGAYTTLHSFSLGDLQGDSPGPPPNAALVQGSDGNFYGTIWGGGTYGFGTVFKISTDGALTTLYTFGSITNANGDPLDGAFPWARLVQGSNGYFYGTTTQGGTNGTGTMFKISTNGTLTSFYSFDCCISGNPDGLVQGSDGNFYGTTYGFRSVPNFGVWGTVFKISTNGALATLHDFFPDRAHPGGLVQGSDGNFYGTTKIGGTNGGYGTVFRTSTNGALTTLYTFGSITNASGKALDGAFPSALVQGTDGYFYGTTSGGGTYGYGTVFRLTIVPQPQLTLIPSGPYMILTWPTNYSEFTLQSTTNLGSSAVWTTNSSPPIVIGGDNVVISTASGKQQFYRLSQ